MDEMKSILQEIGLPFAYSHFAPGEAVDPPFLCWLTDDSDNFAADGIVYHRAAVIHLELYTDRKDPTEEERVQSVLDAHEIFWERSEVWIGEERLYEVLYIFELEV